MGNSGRSFAPVAARRDGSSVVLPEWLREDDAPAPAVPRDHVLSMRSRPTPQTAVDLADRTTPKVDRLAPALRRLRAPRRVWARRAVVAGALVGSCAVLVSGIVLSSAGAGSTPGASAAAPARTLPTADLREELWGGGLFTFGQSTLPSAAPISSAVSVGSADPGYHGPRIVQPVTSDPPAPVVPSSSAPSPTLAPSDPTDSPTPTDPPTTEPPTSDPPTSEPPTSDPPSDGEGVVIELPVGFPFS